MLYFKAYDSHEENKRAIIKDLRAYQHRIFL